jgi:eukaryotic-like serine/threonine-protein kinase
VLNNPFTYGNPISDPRRFFGRAREVEQIFGRLRNDEFESSSLVGERRIGKTSLLNYLADPSVRTSHSLPSERCIFVYVDLQMVDETMGPEQLWHRLLTLMRRQCKDKRVVELLETVRRDERLDTFVLDELFEQIDSVDQKVILLLDEFEHITSNGNFGPDFYYGLRSLVIHHQLALVTSSQRELIELCHSEAIKSSPFFNIFANISLCPFSAADAQHFISQSLDGTAVQFTQEEIGQLFELAGLHPYFLQTACWMLYESYQKGFGQEARVSLLREHFDREATPHLIDYWDNSDDYEKIVLTAAALLEQKMRPEREFSSQDLRALFSGSEPTVKRLERRGLVMSKDGRYRLFSSMFSTWILYQIIAELGEEQSYHAWLEQNQGAIERITGKQAGLLKEILPKIRSNYRQLIITWASDPRTLVAVASILKSTLALVS